MIKFTFMRAFTAAASLVALAASVGAGVKWKA